MSVIGGVSWEPWHVQNAHSKRGNDARLCMSQPLLLKKETAASSVLG